MALARNTLLHGGFERRLGTGDFVACTIIYGEAVMIVFP